MHGDLTSPLSGYAEELYLCAAGSRDLRKARERGQQLLGEMFGINGSSSAILLSPMVTYRGPSFLLKRFEVIRKVGHSQACLRLVLVTHGQEYRSPDRHFLGAVGGNSDGTGDDVNHLNGRKSAVISLRKKGQVGRGCLQGAGNRSISVSPSAMTRSAVCHVHFLSGCGRGAWSRYGDDIRLLRDCQSAQRDHGAT